MDTQMVVYLASVTDNVKVFCLLFGVVCFITVMVTTMGNYETVGSFVHTLKWKVTAGCVITVGVFLCFCAAIIPNGDDLYKIAGVSGQQKSFIDVQGKVLQEGAKK